MIRRLAILLSLCLFAAGLAEESYLGLYMRGEKIGYIAATSEDEAVGGQILKRSDTKTVLKADLLGTALVVTIVSQTWSDDKGSPRLMKFSIDSGGRSQRTEATFSDKSIHVAVDNNGQLSRKTLTVPAGGRIVDDATIALLQDGAAAGSARIYYVLDPTTSTLVKNTAKLVGPAKASVRGKEFDATLIEISEPRGTTRIFVSAKGDLIKAEAIMGIELLPLTKEEALAESAGTKLDIAHVTRIGLNKPLGDIDSLKEASLKFSGVSLARAPSDAHQQVKGREKVWTITTHPVAWSPRGAATIAQAAKQKPQFTLPGTNMPCGSSDFKALASEVVGKTSNVAEAARLVQKYVHREMRPNAGIGVLRDATEVLKTKEGVCRDYAILTATLLRSARIPARLASGLLYYQDAFYYHAWVEFWDGKNWVGLDSTRENGRVTPGHVKLAHGSVEEAFLFTFLDKARVQVLSVRGTAKGKGAH